jgi:hypothetical protein
MDEISRRTVRFGVYLLAVGLLAGAAFSRIQYATPFLPEYDGYYHIKMAQLFRETGFVGEFPWLPLTTFSHRFSDMHLLFHYLLVPFTFLGLAPGAKLYAVVSATLAVLVFFVILRRGQVPWAAFWILALLSSSSFLYRFALPKASQLSLIFLFAGLLLIWSRRNGWLFLLAMLFTASYIAFPILFLLAFFHFVSNLFLEERAEVRPMGFILLGTAAGLLLNPYFPDNVWYYYTQAFQISALQRIPMGGEWYPWDTWYILKENAVVFACLFLALFFSLLQKEKKDARTVTLFFATAFFLFLTFKSRRFIEYFVPFSLLFSAFALREPVRAALASPGNRKRAGLFFLCLFLLVGLSSFQAVERTAREIGANASGTLNSTYNDCARWLHENTPPGSRVFHTDWDDFPALFFFNTHNHYIVGIDPNFLYLRDPRLWQLYAGVTLGQLKDPGAIIRNEFGARYVFTDTQHERFRKRLQEEGGAELRYEDKACAVYELP